MLFLTLLKQSLIKNFFIVDLLKSSGMSKYQIIDYHAYTFEIRKDYHAYTFEIRKD